MGFFSQKKKELEEDEVAIPRRRTRIDDELERVQDLRRRARHRLVGAVVLVLAALVVLPMFFKGTSEQSIDSVQITIPSKSEAPETLALAPEEPVVHEESARINTDENSEQETATLSQPMIVESIPQEEVRAASSLTEANPKPSTTVVEPTPELAPRKDIAALKAEQERLQREKDAKAGRLEQEKKEKQAREKAQKEKDQAEAKRVQALLDGAGTRSESNTSSGTEVESNKKYALQVGAYSTKERADDVKLKAINAGVSVSVAVASRGGAEVFRVRSKSFNSKTEAEAARAKLKAAGLDSSLVAL